MKGLCGAASVVILATAATLAEASPLNIWHRPTFNGETGQFEKRGVNGGVHSLPLRQRSPSPASNWQVADVEKFMLAEATKLETRYGFHEQKEKRAEVTIPLENSYGDSFYSVTIDVGTPPQPFDVIIDTGSSDLWLASDPCTGCNRQTPLYEPTRSSTANVSTAPFSIQYGSGAARGTVASERISLGGLTISRQIFAEVTNSDNILSGTISGILGAGFASISSLQATPLIENMAQQGLLDESIISFALTRWTNVSSSYDEVNAGGILTLGGTNSSLYTGDINWVPLSAQPSYFVIELQAMSLNGQSLGQTAQYAAIDTGTSLIGVPRSVMSALAAAIPNSQSASLQGQSGYLVFPCSQTINVNLRFGGVDYAISPTDFNAGFADSQGRLCYASFFGLQTSSGGPDWIVGASFLKNVYSAFRYSPNPAVGFARLSETAIRLSPLQNGQGNTAADITVSSNGSGSGSGSGTSSGSGSSSTSNSASTSFTARQASIGLAASLLTILFSLV